MSSNNVSIRIPRVFPNISEERIRGVFEDLGWGTISKIDMVRRVNQNGEKYNLVFVHFESWAKGTDSIQDAFKAGKEVKVTYDNPWYWRLTINTAHKHTPEEIAAYKKQTKKPTFEIQDEPETKRRPQEGSNLSMLVEAALNKKSGSTTGLTIDVNM